MFYDFSTILKMLIRVLRQFKIISASLAFPPQFITFKLSSVLSNSPKHQAYQLKGPAFKI